jgi:hypothetical protein
VSLLVLPFAARPALGQALTFAAAGSIPGPVDRIRASGTYLYAATDKTLSIYDVSDPAAPRRAGSYEFPEQIWGFRVEGARAYAAVGHTGLGILDVSNPSTPALVTIVKMPGQAKNVAVAGTRALVANHMSGVDIVDIANLARPSVLGSAYVEGYARDVASFGSVAVAVDNPFGLYVFDLANPNALEPAASLQSAATPTQVELLEVGGARKTRVAVLAGAEPYDPLKGSRAPGGPARPGSLQVFDVSDPSQPVLAATQPTSGNGRRLAVKGSLVYMADGPEGLRVFDLSAPSKPAIAGVHKTATPARDVAVSDTLVFLLVSARDGSRQDDGEVLILRERR